MILSFAEDYRKIIVNAEHELILTRSRTDFNAIMQNVQENPEEFKILLNRVEWKVPYLFSADSDEIHSEGSAYNTEFSYMGNI